MIMLSLLNKHINTIKTKINCDTQNYFLSPEKALQTLKKITQPVATSKITKKPFLLSTTIYNHIVIIVQVNLTISEQMARLSARLILHVSQQWIKLHTFQYFSCLCNHTKISNKFEFIHKTIRN